MKQLQQVVWSKGTFLTPQHLQLQDRFVDDNLQFQLEAVSYRFWGFAGLRIDEAKLVEGQFVLSEASGVAPDGLLFLASRTRRLAFIWRCRSGKTEAST